MYKLSFFSLLLLSLNAHADHPHRTSHAGILDVCLKAVSEIHSGDFIKVEYLSFTDEGVSAYEIELKARDDRTWEFECDASNGNIIEIEMEVDSAADNLFKNKMKISEETARRTVLDLYPGVVEEVEYEIESDGKISYEFDIVDDYLTEYKVEVDATTGEIVEFQIEKWEIGEEDKL